MSRSRPCDALNLGGYIPERNLIESIRRSGRGVNVWTINDLDRMRHLIDLGVTGVFTDYPDRLRDLLDRRDLRREDCAARRRWRIRFARSSVRRRVGLSPLPARLMKY